MHKLFKPRTIRRILLLLALAFPMVYLMGTAFFALNGSHGNVLLAQEEEVVTSSQIVDFNQLKVNPSFDGGTSYYSLNFANTTYDGAFVGETTNSKPCYLTFNPSPSLTASHSYFFSIFSSCSVSDNTKSCVLKYYGVDGALFYFVPTGTLSRFYGVFTPNIVGDTLQILCGWNSFFDSGVTLTFDDIIIVDLTQMYGAGNEPTAEEFLSRYTAEYYDYTLSTKIVEQTTDTPTYSEYLFNQVFGHDNIVTQLGYYALSEEQKGFAPLSALIRFVDCNILLWGDGNALAVFSYGYVYYAMSTLIVYEIVIIATKLLLLPLKAVDVFDRKGDYDD